MPDMNENAETQQEYFGVRTDNKRTLCNALKRIEELEEKLANADYQLEGRDNEIRELEKENAELKGLVNQYKASKCSSISLVNRNMIMSDQLTKAKEIIKAFLDSSDLNIKHKAEEFLGEF